MRTEAEKLNETNAVTVPCPSNSGSGSGNAPQDHDWREFKRNYRMITVMIDGKPEYVGRCCSKAEADEAIARYLGLDLV